MRVESKSRTYLERREAVRGTVGQGKARLVRGETGWGGAEPGEVRRGEAGRDGWAERCPRHDLSIRPPGRKTKFLDVSFEAWTN